MAWVHLIAPLQPRVLVQTDRVYAIGDKVDGWTVLRVGKSLFDEPVVVLGFASQVPPAVRLRRAA